MNNIEELFVPYQESLALKELGFDELCFGRWLVITEWEAPTGQVILQLKVEAKSYNKNQCKAPLYSQAFRWFREKYNLFYDILKYTGNMWKFTIYSHNSEEYFQSAEYKIYEEAEFACLKKLIKIVKENEK
jgi:hypothetical protein